MYKIREKVVLQPGRNVLKIIPPLSSQAELQEIREGLEQVASSSGGFGDLAKRHNLLPLGISMMLMFGQQLSGINAVIFYTTDIFKDAGSSLDPNIESIIVGVVQVRFSNFIIWIF